MGVASADTTNIKQVRTVWNFRIKPSYHGGGRGIGRAIALAYAKEGANLVLASRSQEALEETQTWSRRLGARLW